MNRGRLVSLLNRGLSIDSIAAEVGRSPSTVSYRLKRHGLVANGSARFGPQPPLDAGDLAPLLSASLSVPQMADRLGRSRDVVRRALKRHGLETRKCANRRKADAARARGDARTELECARHGTTLHVLEAERYRCARCRSERVSEHRRRVKRTLLREAGGSCVVCGYDRCEAALQFHHLEPAEKAFHLAFGGVTRSLETLRTEAAKCVVLCATCHAEVEAGYTTLGEDSPGRTRTSKP